MQPPVTHQPVQPPPRRGPAVDIDATDGSIDSELPSQGLFGELVAPVQQPVPDWDWGADDERRRT